MKDMIAPNINGIPNTGHEASNCDSESDTKSSIEAGYVSYDELEDDDKLEATESVRPLSQTCCDGGYISSSEEENVFKDQESLNFLSKTFFENLHQNLNIKDVVEQLNCTENFQTICDGVFVGLPEDYKVPVADIPDWLDLQKFKAGQKFAMDYIFSVNYSNMISLFMLFSFPDGLQPLVYTDKSSTPFTAYKRYLSTVSRVLSWFKHDLWSEGNEGYKNVKTVRAMHLNVSKTLNNTPKDEIKNYLTLETSPRHPALWCPLNPKLEGYFQNICPIINEKSLNELYSNKIHFNQTSMSLTQFGFFGLIILYPDKFGAANASQDELESYVHLWRSIGYLLGIEDKYNFCRGSFEEVKQRCREVISVFVKPNFRKLSKGWEHMSRCVIQGISYYIPMLNFESCFAYLCWVMELDTPEYYASLTWKQYLIFKHTQLFMCYTLRIPGVLGFCNKRVLKLIEAEKLASAEKLERLKNIKYDYNNDDIIVTRL